MLADARVCSDHSAAGVAESASLNTAVCADALQLRGVWVWNHLLEGLPVDQDGSRASNTGIPNTGIPP